MIKNWKILLTVIIAFHLLLLINLRFTAWPEMLLWPYLIIHGIFPYKDFAMAHTPNLVTTISGVFAVFGTGIWQLKIFTWLLIIVSDILVFWVASRIWNKKTAFIAVVFYTLLNIIFDGNGLWFDLALAPLSLLVFYLLKQKRKYFLSGIIFGLMVMTKQTAAWFIIPVLFTIFSDKDSGTSILKRIRNFVLGGLLIGSIYAGILFALGIFNDFIKWAIEFGVFILPRSSGQIQLPAMKNLLVVLFPFVAFIFLVRKNKILNFDVFIWALFGAMGIYPRFEYFHLQPALPFLAFAVSFAITSVSEKGIMKKFLVIFLIAFAYLFGTYFIRNWNEGTRFMERSIGEVVDYIKENTKSGDKIFVLNWWDNVYALTDTIPATIPWVPQLSWYQEINGVQEREIEDLKNAKPKIILMQNYSVTGLASYKPQKLYDYIETNYRYKEKIDGISVLVPKDIK